MKMHKPYALIATVFSVLLSLSAGKTALADDTDIYVNNTAASGS